MKAELIELVKTFEKALETEANLIETNMKIKEQIDDLEMLNIEIFKLSIKWTPTMKKFMLLLKTP